MLAQPDLHPLEPDAAAKLALLAPLVEYSLKAADELDPVIEEKRDEMFADAARVLAKTMSGEEIRLAAEILETPAARKGFNVLYAVSRLFTGYNHEDMRRSQELRNWTADLKLELKANPFAPSEGPPPPPERVAKAQSIVTDFMRISQIDDMVGEFLRFYKDVVLQVDNFTDEERATIQTGMQQFEFYYNLGKSMAIAVAPSALASALDDEQLGKLRLVILSPVLAKSFGMIYTVVREMTSFTVPDLQQFRALSDEAEQYKSSRTDADRQRIEAEWELLGDKWRKIFEDRLTPETREGLQSSFDAFKALVEEEKRKKQEDEGAGPPEAPPGQTRL